MAATNGRSVQRALDAAEHELRRGSLEEAQRLLPTKAVPPELRPRALWLKGWLELELGNGAEAISILQLALDAADKVGDPRERVRARYTLAMAYYRSSQYQHALVLLQTAVPMIMQHLDDRLLLGRVTICMADISYVRGNLGVALEQYARARELFEGFDDPHDLAAVYAGLSRVHGARGNLEEALRYARMSVSIHERWNNKRDTARELVHQANVLRDLGRTQEARDSASRAADMAAENGVGDARALAHASLAAISLAEGNLREAAREADAVEAISGETSEIARIDAWIVLAKVAECEGDGSRAEDLMAQAVAALSNLGHGALLTDAALNYSQRLQEDGNYEAALRYAMKAARVGLSRSS